MHWNIFVLHEFNPKQLLLLISIFTFIESDVSEKKNSYKSMKWQLNIFLHASLIRSSTISTSSYAKYYRHFGFKRSDKFEWMERQLIKIYPDGAYRIADWMYIYIFFSNMSSFQLATSVEKWNKLNKDRLEYN